MSVDDPAVMTCAISGMMADREQCLTIPYTPAEYAAEARRPWRGRQMIQSMRAHRRAGRASRSQTT